MTYALRRILVTFPLLLAVSPESEGGWRWSDLAGSVREALELSELRAVEPDMLAKTAYAQLLPATVLAVTERQSTFSLDLAETVARARVPRIVGGAAPK